MTESLTDETIREWMYRLDGVEPLVKERFHSLGQALLDTRAEFAVADRTCADLLANDYRLMQEKDAKLRVAEADNAVLVNDLDMAADWLEKRPDYTEGDAATSSTIRHALAQPHPGAALLERFAKLEAVVAAARLVCEYYPKETPSLQDALADLDAEAHEQAPDLEAFRAARGVLK